LLKHSIIFGLFFQGRTTKTINLFTIIPFYGLNNGVLPVLKKGNSQLCEACFMHDPSHFKDKSMSNFIISNAAVFGRQVTASVNFGGEIFLKFQQFYLCREKQEHN